MVDIVGGKEFYGLLEDEELKETTFLLLANKIDVENHMDRLDILRHFNLSDGDLGSKDERRTRSMNVSRKIVHVSKII